LKDKLFNYINPFFTHRGGLDLGVLGGGATPPNLGNLSPNQLGSLAPAAGGNLGDLSPSAGGMQGNTTVNCANSYFQQGWDKAPDEANFENCEIEPDNNL
jgi:hypothetical protein